VGVRTADMGSGAGAEGAPLSPMSAPRRRARAPARSVWVGRGGGLRGQGIGFAAQLALVDAEGLGDALGGVAGVQRGADRDPAQGHEHAPGRRDLDRARGAGAIEQAPVQGRVERFQAQPRRASVAAARQVNALAAVALDQLQHRGEAARLGDLRDRPRQRRQRFVAVSVAEGEQRRERGGVGERGGIDAEAGDVGHGGGDGASVSPIWQRSVLVTSCPTCVLVSGAWQGLIVMGPTCKSKAESSKTTRDGGAGSSIALVLSTLIAVLCQQSSQTRLKPRKRSKSATVSG